MACGACARRRKALEAKRLQKKARGQKVQAAALGAVLAVTGSAAKALGIEVTDGRDDTAGGGAGQADGSAEPDR